MASTEQDVFSNPFAYDPKTLLKGGPEKQLGDVKGGFTGSKEYPPNAMGHLHSTMAFSFVVPESVSSNSKLSKLMGKTLGEAQQTTGAGAVGKISTIAQATGKLTGKASDWTGMTTGAAQRWESAMGATKMNVTDSQVILPMPNTLQMLDGATWAPIDADPSFIGLLTKVAGDIVKGDSVIEAIAKGAGAMAKEIGQGMFNKLLAEGGGEGLFQAYTKSLENPFTDMAFQSMQRRTFQLAWQFFPKNDAEVVSIKGIINMFRLHMHPNLSEGQNGNWLDFPSMVIPSFLFMGSQSPFLPRIAMSVINNVSVNASPNGMWTVHSDGMPPHIQLSIELSEVQPLLKEDIGAGY